MAVIYVGAASEVEMKEKKDRFDDALHATRATVEEGFLFTAALSKCHWHFFFPGGGTAFVRAAQCLDAVKPKCCGCEHL